MVRKSARFYLHISLAMAFMVGAVIPMEAASTFYLSPSGSDSNSGTSSSPWRTFNFALPRLQAGDTLVLKDGTYDGSNSGYPKISCGSGPNNGISGSPITIKAENERKAFLQGNGNQFVLEIVRCSYWTFEGLRLRSADSAGISQGHPLMATDSNNLIFRRLLITHNNRYQNDELLLLYNTSSSVVEESEFYSFHRHAVSTKYGSNNVIRRNYANSRGYADISGGYASGESSRGDDGFIIYPGTNTIVENNISEGNMTGFGIEASGSSDGNQIVGNISRNDFYGALIIAREGTPRNNTFKDFVVIGARYPGVYSRGAVNTQCVNCSVYSSGQGLVADKPSEVATTPSFFATNVLVTGNDVGFNILDQATWTIDYANSYSNGTNYNPSTSTNYKNTLSVNPSVTSPIFIPSASPLKGAGKNGADIGANVLYRYVNGALTTQPLWNASSGAFTCGAVIPGVNDVVGSSCFDVHTRLNVSANTLPSGYGGGSTPTTTSDKPGRPKNPRLVQTTP